MKRLIGLGLVTLALTGCLLRPGAPADISSVDQPPAKPQRVVVQPPPPPSLSPPPTDVVPEPPKFDAPLDWAANVQPLVDQMLKTEGIAPGSVLLVESVKNSTDGSLQVDGATQALLQALSNTPTFKLVANQDMAVAMQTLGLSMDDSLAMRSKAIGLARYLKAQYVLYSTLQGEAQAPQLSMQLMQVQSAEIVWSGQGDVKR